MESRHNDETPVRCHSCGWTGKAKDCIHDYEPVPFSSGDVVPVDHCPRCGNGEIEPMEGNRLVPA